MQYITLNDSFTAVIRIPESQSGDSVSYVIYKSDGSTFASGSASYVAGNNWKVTFTPLTNNETYILEITDTTLDITRTESFIAKSAPQVALDESEALTSSELLTKVNQAISARMNGGAVQSYSIGGRNLEYMTLRDLTEFRDKLKKEVSAAALAKNTQTHARFNGAI